MNRTLVDKLVNALLYEGYVLYPYRPSVKNSQRWTFGGIYPKAWSDAQTGSDSCTMQTECLIAGSEQSSIQIIVRFLHLVDRQVGVVAIPIDELSAANEPDFQPVPFVQMNGQTYQSWQEAEEREIDLGELRLADLIAQNHQKTFEYSDRRTVEPLRNEDGRIAAVLVRQQHRIRGAVKISAVSISDNLFKLTIQIINQTDFVDLVNRNFALMNSLISTHTILGIEAGEFVSLTDPPDELRDAARQCRNIGAWPVLVGDGVQRNTILSSPIILYDYPQLAPESPGDLFDSTEIDEILTLRIMTLTEEEKRAACGVDRRVADLLARTDALARDQLMNLHGTIRGLRPVPQEQQ